MSKTISKLAQKSKQIYDILNSTGVQVALLDTDLKVIWANDDYLKFYQDNVKNKFCFEHQFNRKQPCELCNVKKSIKDRQIHSGVLFVENPDGIKRFFHSISIPVFSHGKDSGKVLELNFDITESKILEKEITERAQFLETIAQDSMDAIICMDPDEKITFWNQGANRMFGYKEDEVIGKKFNFLVPDDKKNLKDLEEINQMTNEFGFINGFETERVTKSGTRIIVEVTRTKMKDEYNSVFGTSAIIRNITNRKRLEIWLNKTISGLSKIHEIGQLLHIRNSMEDILKVILTSVTAGQGLKFNRAFILLVDENNKKIKGKMAIGPDSIPDAAEIYNGIKKTHYSLEYIIKNKIYENSLNKEVNKIVKKLSSSLSRKDNIIVRSILDSQTYIVKNGRSGIDFNEKVIDILGSENFVITPLIWMEKPMGVLIVDNNITKKEINDEDIQLLETFANQAGLAISNAQLDENLQQRLKELQITYSNLEKSQEMMLSMEHLAALGEVTTNISHEIRNPLAAIGGFARSLSKSNTIRDNEKEFAEIIIKEVLKLEKIMNSILNYSKIYKPNLEKADLRDSISHCVELALKGIDRSNYDINISLPESPVILNFDHEQITRVLFNLIQNAFQAMTGDGSFNISLVEKKNNAIIKISDTGKGIEKKDIPSLFKPFYSTKEERIGLGLSICQKIITNHKGKIEVFSKKGEGTTFMVTIPLQKKD